MQKRNREVEDGGAAPFILFVILSLIMVAGTLWSAGCFK